MLYSEAESKETKTPHEYIRDILPFRYQECISCGNRTDLTCIRCGYCYSCHWKKEKEEKKVLNNRISEIFPSSLILTRKNRLIEKEVEQQQSLSEQRHQQQLIVDVYGRASEPICTYHRCSHKFSVHGLGNCKCRHPTNKILGVFTRYP